MWGLAITEENELNGACAKCGASLSLPDELTLYAADELCAVDEDSRGGGAPRWCIAETYSGNGVLFDIFKTCKECQHKHHSLHFDNNSRDILLID